MNLLDAIEILRRESKELCPVDLAARLNVLAEDGLSQSSLIFYFKKAFPSIPLRTLIEAGAWNRVSNGGLSDDEFNELLSPWLRINQPPER